MTNLISCDVVIVGSGIAGLTVAWKLAKEDKNLIIKVITKKEKAESNTNYAQGGIAAVFSTNDSFSEHIQDTSIAGDGLCYESVVKLVVEQGPERIKELIELGVNFSYSDTGKLDLGREGGHSKRRVIHASDLTGREIERALLNYCDKFENLKILENIIGVDLHCNSKNEVIGVYGYDIDNQKIVHLKSKQTVLATGGAGKVYMVTSNPNIATGDGIAMAARAGASIGNIEFTQFHPTCVYNPSARSSTFLISEALRGEGAKLVDKNNIRFMSKYDKREELAPRDVVARAIDSELKISGEECVYLDISHKNEQFLRQRFPGIYQALLKIGYDLTADKIPVVPAAHYFCGGIITNKEGHTDLSNLYAVGEVSCTGLHGANRLASNSLLEAVVFADKVAKSIFGTFKKEKITNSKLELKIDINGRSPVSEDKILISQNWDELRLTMTNYVGIVRSNERLTRALKRINLIKEEVNKYFEKFRIDTDIIELRNLVEVSELIILSAIGRKESRGIHFNIDYPYHIDKALPSVIQKNEDFKYIYRDFHSFFESKKH